MKRLFLILFVLLSLNLDAQFITNYAKNVNTKEIDGFYYYLPRNVIRLDFVVEKQQFVKGKYSDYAKEMLNTDNYIKENRTSYVIKNINISTLTEADPNYVFFISADEKSKDNLDLNLELTPEGILQSIGYNNMEISNSTNVSYNEKISVDEKMSEYNYIVIRDEDDEEEIIADTKMSDKEIAASIINEIKNIRVAYFDLISGYQEVNYGNTLNYMVEELKELEQEYLSMFLGKSSKHVFTKTFYVVPEENENSIILCKFSDTEGFNTKVGENVKINFTDSSIGLNVNKMSKDEIQNATYNNKIFYRNPADVTLQIMSGNDVISENRLTISQLGNIILIPTNKMKFIFDANTGQIISITKE